MKSTKFIAYIRKSQESDERQELSMPAQRREVMALLQKQCLHLVGEPIEEARTAKEPGRPGFNRMIDMIRDGRANGIIVWHPDRLARNPLDGGVVMWLLGTEAIQAIVTPGRTYTSSGDDKLMLSIIFGMATKYSDDLSANIKRGNREALARGLWPGYPKLGYVRDPATKMLLRDPERFEIARELWRLLLSRRPVPEILRFAIEERDLRTPRFGRNGGKHLQHSRIYKMFRDPFYAGIMVRGGERFHGAHEPMVTAAEFEEAQAILDGRRTNSSRPKRLFFAYRGLITCGACGGAVTAKITVNRYGTRYRHYYCARKNRPYNVCPEGAIREEEMERQLAEAIRQLTPPPAWVKAAIDAADRRVVSEQGAMERVKDRSEKALAEARRRLESLRRLLVDGVITSEDYATDREKLLLEERELRERAERATDGRGIIEPLRASFSLLNQAADAITKATDTEKRDLAQMLFSNLQVKAKTMLIEAKKPFSVYGKWTRSPSMWTEGESNPEN